MPAVGGDERFAPLHPWPVDGPTRALGVPHRIAALPLARPEHEEVALLSSMEEGAIGDPGIDKEAAVPPLQ